jgi:hypothetical protein
MSHARSKTFASCHVKTPSSYFAEQDFFVLIGVAHCEGDASYARQIEVI